MKRLKFLSYAFILISVFTLSSCAEDAILEEIIDNTELGVPSLDTDDEDEGDTPPSATGQG
ncbi:MAG: hypothetical protein R8G66_10920 [Cytophagales bacterium]|nr:hypothetical protein [Cytophagales bacterium]